MKSLVILGAYVAAGLAQTAQFTNTSFAGPFTVGQKVPVMWTVGNGLPITLSIFNSTWNHTELNRAVLPTNYDWLVSAVPGFATGNYQLALQQVNGGAILSPVFSVIIPDMMSAMPSATPAPVAVATMTFVYWDDTCGCTKTSTAAMPLNTTMPHTTTKWWDEQCGCHKSAVIPATTMSVGNNYTVPAPRPAPTGTTQNQNMAPTTGTTATSTRPTFSGEGRRLECSMFGLVALFAVLVIV